MTQFQQRRFPHWAPCLIQVPLLLVLFLPGIATAQSVLMQANLAASASPSRPSSVPPRISPAVFPIFIRAQRWVMTGNFDQAIRVINGIVASPFASPFDRYKANLMLAYLYRRLGNLPAAIRAERSILASRFFALEAPTPPLELAARRQRLLQIAKDELSLGEFAAARADAEEVLALNRATPFLLPSQQTQAAAIEIRQQAMQRNKVRPAAASSHAAAQLPVVEPRPSIAPQEKAFVCATVLAAANDGSLATLSVAVAPAPHGTISPAATAGAPSNATRLDLFGTGVPVYLMSTQGFGGSSPAGLEVLDAKGAPVRLRKSSDHNWGRLEDGGPDQSLIKVSGRLYILGTTGDHQARYVLAVAKNRVLQVLCEFAATDSTVAGNPQVRLMTPFEGLVADTAYEGYDRSPVDYVLTQPGTGPTAILLDAVQRRHGGAPRPAMTPSLYDGYGRSLLMLAIAFGRDDIVRYLLEHGVDPDLADRPGRFAMDPATPLDAAVGKNDLTAATLLLAHGANPNAPAFGNGNGNVAMSAAFQHGSVAMLRLLLAHGGAPNFGPTDISDLIGRKPDAADMAAKIDLLLRAGADPDVWTHTLFNAIANRSALASARTLHEREGGCLPESARYIPVKTAWVNALLENPTRAQDNGLEPLLREAVTLRDAASRNRPPHPEPVDCGGEGLATSPPRPKPAAPRASAALPAAARSISPIPLGSRDSFLAYSASILQKRLPPGYAVIPDRGVASVLVMDNHGAKLGHLNVEQQYRWCQGTPASCSLFVTRWSSAARDAIAQFARPANPDSLVVVVGTRSQFQARLEPRAASAPVVLMRSCLPKLVCTISARVSGGERMLDVGDLAALHLTDAAAFRLATAHLRQRLEPSLSLRPPSAEKPIRFINYDRLESSLLLLHSRWAALAKATGGRLIAAIPASNLAVYSTDDGPGSIENFQRFVAACMPSAVHPLSPHIYRWRADGWQLVQ